MNYFLVDYENVNVSGFDGISSLTENDVVIIFYSENADTLTFGLHRRINESKADVKFQRVLVTGKQALDFQLCSYLGFLICDTMGKTDSEESSNNYYIVSNDNGYVVLTEYWKKRKINLTVVSNLKKESINAVQKISAQPNNKADALTVKLNTILKDKTSISETLKIINNAKTKVELNNNLGKKFSTEKAGEIYRAIKPLIADMKSS